MDWILDHLQLILLIAGAVAYWLNQRRREQQGEAADYDADGKPERLPRGQEMARGEEAERTRRIQEEIRRKIMERRGQPPPLPAPEMAPRPVVGPVLADLAEMLGRRQEVETRAAEQQALDEQRAHAARMEELEAQREAAQREADQAMAAVQASAKRATAAAAEARWREEHHWLTALRDPKNARRAIVMRELLGPPVGLR